VTKRIIIDCDAGVDDALGLILAFHSPELDVEAITAVNGNVAHELVCQNIRRILTLLQPSRTPIIARGADRPLCGHATYAHHVHGEHGLGDAKLPFRGDRDYWEESSLDAAALIPNLARVYPQDVTLIATGPLTNIALSLRADLEGMRLLREVIVMGGAVRTRGNITAYAEFNIFADPLAAREVFESGLPVRLVPLDVTHRVFLSPRIMDETIHPMSTPFSRFVIDATGYDLASHSFRRGDSLFYLHDPLAVGVAIDPALAEVENLPLTVENSDPEHLGHTRECSNGLYSIEACVTVNSERFLDLFLSRLSATPV
jgi:inosine-uridine nucleoside N-ribohydrolase